MTRGQGEAGRRETGEPTPLAEELAALRLELETERARGAAELTSRARRIELLSEQLREARKELEQARREAASIRKRRAVRLVLSVTDRARPAVAAGRRFRAFLRDVRPTSTTEPTGPTHRLRASTAAETSLRERLVAVLIPSPVTTGPLVSVLIRTHDGIDRLRTLLPALDALAYRDIEVVLDDAANDGGVAANDGGVAANDGLATRHPNRIIRSSTDGPSSARDGQTATAGSGEFLLLIDDDSIPAGNHVLGHMVALLQTDPSIAAVASRLIHPRRTGPANGAVTRAPDLTLAHRGVTFEIRDGVPRARDLGSGEDPIGPAASTPAELQVARTACLLVRRSAFEAVGGFTPGYDDDTQDVDLCLKLRANGGRIVYEPQATFWHEGSATTRAASLETRPAPHHPNPDPVGSLWGPRLFRQVLLDRLTGAGAWSPQPIHVAITVTRDDPTAGFADWSIAHELGGSLADLGWRVSYLESWQDRWYQPDVSIDVVIALLDAFDVRRLPDGMITVAWIGDGTDRWIGQPWFDEYDMVLASSVASKELIDHRTVHLAGLLPPAPNLRDILIAWAAQPRIDIAIGPPRWEVVDNWGDYHFARALQRVLQRRGHATRVRLLPDWEGSSSNRADAAIHLFGLKERRTRPGQVSVLWIISHPELVTDELILRNDLVFAASDPFAARITERTGKPVVPLHQATDPDRFQPLPGGPHHELLFVANSRKVRRTVTDELTATEHDLAVYGRDWTSELLDPRYLRGRHIPNDQLASYYAAADIVLNDHWADMAEEGFLSNRLYDASASGAFVISDTVAGIAEEFDGGIVTFATGFELRSLVDRYLADPAARAEHAKRASAAVLARHTFDQRATGLLQELGPVLAARNPLILTTRESTSAEPVSAMT